MGSVPSECDWSCSDVLGQPLLATGARPRAFISPILTPLNMRNTHAEHNKSALTLIADV